MQEERGNKTRQDVQRRSLGTIYSMRVSSSFRDCFRYETAGILTDMHMYVHTYTSLPVLNGVIIRDRQAGRQTGRSIRHTHIRYMHICIYIYMLRYMFLFELSCL